MSTNSSRSVSRSGTPLGTRPPSTNTTTRAATSSSLSDATSNPHNNNHNNNYFSYPVGRVVSGLYRRLTDPPQKNNSNRNANNMNSTHSSSTSLYTPKRTASPFQPPPLTPLTLKSNATGTNSHILSRALAEEIRLLVPPRLQLVDTWRLAYSLERDGSSLSTLYDHCRKISEHHPRAGYVLVVRDTSDGGAVFGAYLTDAPHPASHFYGTGECFLWRASVLGGTQGVWINHNNNNYNNHNENSHEVEGENSNGHGYEFHTMTDAELQRAGFPPPPSADTTHAVRSTTLRASTPKPQTTTITAKNNLLSLPQTQTQQSSSNQTGTTNSGTSTPERIRFKAFPYSGMNDYMMFCETGFLSVGGG